MTNEKKLEIIKSYIDDIKAYEESHDWPLSKKKHIRRAREAYINLYKDAENGKLDPDLLHENITSFMYMLQ
ncbi:hypothetical protein [Acetivibrio mesophilus]|uniref:Uncharacterized protein n=1 Tax=Acetivibrio mesophilus TaxID=2487273 RepID=A0A4Q0I633_9FIRM|nr:hypothetical protein [Acetivibrio mesophilus]ODM25146.1 hypothetical protein A7W90_02305 [Clostridium sp. Bc-iso-3]RXE59836.1 hypothetical protein EFD62_05870 [Acetivibrio mesophilus]HHV29624.1 hypothetical protein [Clostridium sp.]